MAHLVIAAA